MAMIDFTCPTCGKHHRVRDEFAGKRACCPGCQTTLTIPQITQPEGVPVAATDDNADPSGVPPSTPEPFQPPPTTDSAEPCKNSTGLFSTKIAPLLVAGFALLAIIMFFLPWIKFSSPKTEIEGRFLDAQKNTIGNWKYSFNQESISAQSGCQIALNSSGDVETSWMLTFSLVFLSGVMLLGLSALARGNVGKRALWICACVVCFGALVLTIVGVSVRSWSGNRLLLFAPSFLFSVVLVSCFSFAWAGPARHGLWIYAFVVCWAVLCLAIVYLELEAESIANRRPEVFEQVGYAGYNYFDMYGIWRGKRIAVDLTAVPYLFLAFLTLTCVSSAAAGIKLPPLVNK